MYVTTRSYALSGVNTYLLTFYILSLLSIFTYVEGIADIADTCATTFTSLYYFSNSRWFCLDYEAGLNVTTAEGFRSHLEPIYRLPPNEIVQQVREVTTYIVKRVESAITDISF